MSVRVNTAALDRLAGGLDRGASSAASILSAEIAAAIGPLGDIGISAIKAVTPVRSGALRDSTSAQSAQEDTSLVITILQPATTKADQSGHWGGRFYVQWVVGGRGPVKPIAANGKKAIVIPGVGPRKSAKAAPANPYPDRAALVIEADVRTEAGVIAAGVAEGIRGALFS